MADSKPKVTPPKRPKQDPKPEPQQDPDKKEKFVPPSRGPGITIPRGQRKVREGLVVSDKMDKTVVVTVEDRVKHALYGKVMRRATRLKAHDEENEAKVGDLVRIMETRPISKTKHWRIVEIIDRAK